MNINTILAGFYKREHCVPTNELFAQVISVLRGEHEPEDKLVSLVESFCRVAYLTKCEAGKVDEHYKQSVPCGWQPTNKDAWLARYKDFGIELKRPPCNFDPDLSGRKAEMDYARLGWQDAAAAKEIVQIWNSGMNSPCIPIRAILVGYSHSNCWISEKCRVFWDAAILERKG